MVDLPQTVTVLHRFREVSHVLGHMSDALDGFTVLIESRDEWLGALARCLAIDLCAMELRIEALANRLEEAILHRWPDALG